MEISLCSWALFGFQIRTTQECALRWGEMKINEGRHALFHVRRRINQTRFLAVVA